MQLFQQTMCSLWWSIFSERWINGKCRDTTSSHTTEEAAISTDEFRSNDVASVARVATKLEVFVIPVSDVDRAKEFYGSARVTILP